MAFFVVTWQFIGFGIVLLLAGLQGISPELREAAAIDGASSWQITRRIMLPLLGPTIRIWIFLAVIGSLQLFDIVWTNYATILTSAVFWQAVQNSAIIAVVATTLAMVLGSMAAFALSRYTFRGREGLFLLFTAGLLFPLNTAALPLFLLLQKIGMNDNLFGVALPEAAFSLPVTIVILRPFMRAIPAELEDAATVDGATRIRFFLRILLPLSRPALITVGMLAFVTSWNTYLLPLIVLSTPAHYTLPLSVAMFQSQYSTDTAKVFAYTALSMLPALSIFVFAQRYLVGGLVGAIRG